MKPRTKRRADVSTPAPSENVVLEPANDTAAEIDAQAGKALAVWLYNVGAATLDGTRAKFLRRPSWRSA